MRKCVIVRETVREMSLKGGNYVPDVAFCGEAAVLHALWRHPAYRQHPSTADLQERKKTFESEDSNVMRESKRQH